MEHCWPASRLQSQVWHSHWRHSGLNSDIPYTAMLLASLWSVHSCSDSGCCIWHSWSFCQNLAFHSICRRSVSPREGHVFFSVVQATHSRWRSLVLLAKPPAETRDFLGYVAQWTSPSSTTQSHRSWRHTQTCGVEHEWLVQTKLLVFCTSLKAITVLVGTLDLYHPFATAGTSGYPITVGLSCRSLHVFTPEHRWDNCVLLYCIISIRYVLLILSVVVAWWNLVLVMPPAL